MSELNLTVCLFAELLKLCITVLNCQQKLEPSKNALKCKRYRERRKAVLGNLTEKRDTVAKEAHGVERVSKGCRDTNGGTIGGYYLSNSSMPQKRKSKNSRLDHPGSLPRARETYTAEFELFWSIYPRKEAKRHAFNAFCAALERVQVYSNDRLNDTMTMSPTMLSHADVLANGARRYADYAEQNRLENRFIKHPSTWLNADSWLDELPGPPQPYYKPGGFMDVATRMMAEAKARESLNGQRSPDCRGPSSPYQAFPLFPAGHARH